MSYNNSYKSDNYLIENKKLNNNLYEDFCFWVNNHTNLSDCISKIFNLYKKYRYFTIVLIFLLFLFKFF